MHKQLLAPEPARQLPRQFSWLDQQWVRGGHLDRCDHTAWALYLFLVTVADAQGLSYYSDAAVLRWVKPEPATLSAAREQLLAAGLLAYRRPLYQLLALPRRGEPVRPGARCGVVRSVGELLWSMTTIPRWGTIIVTLQTTTLIAAVRLQGPQAPWLFDGPLNDELFLAWVTQGLVPGLQRDDVVILDNLATHKMAGVQKALAAAGARLEYLPPYSPDFTPIENLWSKVKQGLKSRAPRTARQLFKAAGAAFDSVTSEDCHGFFLHAGYATCFMETL